MQLPITATFDYPTVGAIVDYLLSNMNHSHSTEPSVSAQTTKQLESVVLSSVASILGTSVQPDEPLMDAGLDSLTATELSTTISRVTGIDMPVTAMFDYPSASAIAAFLHH